MLNHTRLPNSSPQEPVGKRIARLRSERGWTQQSLAARLAISRVAVSHIEMDLTFPSERTILLLAGLFKLTPHELVEGTTYPQAKAERLPPIACCHTQLEVKLFLMDNDLEWLGILSNEPNYSVYVRRVLQCWSKDLQAYEPDELDEHERGLLAAARTKLAHLQEECLANSDSAG
jgi:transcriptional regulator with XRE-family HTH domain